MNYFNLMYTVIIMTVNELQDILKSLQDKGYGNIPICISADAYNLFLCDIGYVDYRSHDNCLLFVLIPH